MSYVISYFEKESEKSITRYIYFLNKLRIVEYTDIYLYNKRDLIFHVFFALAKYFTKYASITFHSIISKLHLEFFEQTKYRIYFRLASAVTGSINQARNLSKIAIVRATV